MKNKTLLILAILAGVVLLVYKKAKAAVGLDYQLGIPQKFRITNGPEGKQLEFRLPIDVDNKRNTKLYYQGADIMVTAADNKPLGRIWDKEPREIEPMAVTTIYLPVILSGQNTVNLIALAAAAVFQNWNLDQRSIILNFEGSVKGEGFVLPITGYVKVDPRGFI